MSALDAGLGDLRALNRLAPPPAARLRTAVLLGALASASGVGLMAVSAWLISRAAQHPQAAALTLPAACVQALALGRALFRYLERLTSHDLAFRQLADLRVEVAERVEPLAPAGLAAFRRGDLLSTLVNDVDVQQDLTLRVIEPLTVCAVVGTLAVIATACLLPVAGVVLALVLGVAIIVAPVAHQRSARRANAVLASRQAALTDLVLESLRSAPDLAVNGATDGWLRRLEHADDAIDDATRRIGRANGTGAALSVLLGGVALWTVAVVSVPAVRNGSLPGVALATLVLLPIALWESVTTVSPALSALDRVRASAGRLLRVLRAPNPVPDPPVPVALPAGAATLELSQASAQWPLAADDPEGERPHGVAAVDLRLPPGRRVAVVGPSGAGKTTLVATLLRYVDVHAGRYDANGVNVRTVEASDVRDLIGHVSAEAHVFDSTVRENLRFARPGASDDDLRQAITAANLGHWFAGLPLGLDTWVGERGARMSAGERTRLSLARALLADRPILLLDEPTAGLDDAVASQVLDRLLSLPDRSVVLVTHRDPRPDQVQQIITVDNGRITARTSGDAITPDTGAD
ncbi:MAG TPA: thiol reductant ABC exporter subunit CydC [Mycobacteriales bacterium]|nr:thiol reductant ABC exporter subunit CydC [Mycobacteriales bacterium]